MTPPIARHGAFASTRAIVQVRQVEIVGLYNARNGAFFMLDHDAVATSARIRVVLVNMYDHN
ncbi:MAG: hypothetical protein ABJQ90_10715 [Parasphingorhabdus sp.]